MDTDLNYVNVINKNEITLIITDSAIIDKIKLIGGKKRFLIKDFYVIAIENEQQKLDILQTLIDTDNLYFAGGGHGWPPAAIVEDYREKGMLKGKIKQISWTGSGPIFKKI